MLCLTPDPMLSLRLHCTRAITVALLFSNAFADTIILKSGEKIEGKVIKETEKDLTLAVKVSASITDERVVARTEIDRIEKILPETEAYKAIATIQTPANSLAASQYETLVAPLENYLGQYPNSPHAKDVQKALDEINAEKTRVEGGEVKLRGEWLSKEEVDKEKIQIGGLLAFEHMKNQSASGDSVGALNTFATIEKSYAGSVSLPDAIELARQLVASMKPVVERAIPDQKAFKAQKEQGFAGASPADRVEMTAAYKAEVAQADAAVTAAETASKWPPFIATNEKSLKSLLARITRESSSLEKLPTDRMKSSVQLTNTAKQKIASGDPDAAADALKEATKLWPANELAGRLTKEVTALQKAAPKEAPATPEPATPKPKATPKPSAALKAAAPAATPAPEEPKPFFMTLPGAIGIVVGIAAILAGVNIFQKMKARKSSPAE